MPYRRRGITSNAVLAVTATLVVLGGLVYALFRMGAEETQDEPELFFYCAAGIKRPVQQTIDDYERELGVKVTTSYAGSGTLLSTIQGANRGDIYLAADKSYIDIARSKGLLLEVVPLAEQKPVIAVRKGNPKNIRTIDDLLQPDVQYAIANPEAASIGKLTMTMLKKSGHWEQIRKNAKVTQPTVNEIANSVQLGAVDAAIVWDPIVRQLSDKLDMVEIPLFDQHVKQIHIGVLKTCKNPAAALRFCRYLQAPKKGGENFERHGYAAVQGDQWAERPTINLYSGGVNRMAIQDTISDFEQREGVTVNVNYNGCGILVGQIKGGSRPDAYFACDTSFMTQVSDVFPGSFSVSETDMIVAVPKGNPKQIQSIEDLGRDGLKVGVANEKQSALGKLTTDLLKDMQLYDSISKNYATQTPTADLLVNQLRSGSLDAAIVYRANVSQVMDKVHVIEIRHPRAKAVQPIAICKDTKYPYLTRRLVDAMTSAESRRRFHDANFRWVMGNHEN